MIIPSHICMQADVGWGWAKKSWACKLGHGQAGNWNWVDTNWAVDMNTCNLVQWSCQCPSLENGHCGEPGLLLVLINCRGYGEGDGGGD